MDTFFLSIIDQLINYCMLPHEDGSYLHCVCSKA